MTFTLPLGLYASKSFHHSMIKNRPLPYKLFPSHLTRLKDAMQVIKRFHSPAHPDSGYKRSKAVAYERGEKRPPPAVSKNCQYVESYDGRRSYEKVTYRFNHYSVRKKKQK